MFGQRNPLMIFWTLGIYGFLYFIFISLVSGNVLAVYYQSTILSSQTLTLDLTNEYYAQPSFLVNAYTMDIEVADFDNDGCKDAAVATFYNTQHKMFWGNCDGTWTEANQFGVRTGWGIDSADFNEDGYLDVVLGTYPNFGGPTGNYLFIDNKDRTFTGTVTFGTGNTTNLHTQDINNDNFPDVIVPVAGQSRIYTNNGDGTFTSSNLLTSINTMNLRLFDLDKDGDLDVLKSEYSGGTTYNINNGNGTYTSYVVTGSVTSDMTPIDFDKDGDWDFTVAVQGQSFLYVNNGNGTWTKTNQFGTRNTNVHNVRDLDGNGYDDVIAANGAWGSSQQNYIYYNNGDGTFTETAAFGTGSTYAMHFVDIDGDGDEDVVVGNWNNNGNAIYYNGYYSTSKNFSYPVSLPSGFVNWKSLDVSELKKPGTSIQYSIYPSDSNNDGICNDGSVLLGPVSSASNQVDISSLAGNPICVLVVLSTSRVVATPKVTELKITYIADASAPIGLTLDAPSGYTKDLKPTFVFKKATDSDSGISSYTVMLDEGKSTSFSTSGIPAAGDNSKSSFIWKNDASVKIEFTNEDDGEGANDTIRVYFKGYDANELTEGKHAWKVTAYDNVGNVKEESKEFFLDRSNPTISELNWINELSHRPSFSGKVIDSYRQGDIAYDKVSSGPQMVNLAITKRDGVGHYVDYLSKDYSLSDIVDISGDQKYTRFSIAVSDALGSGWYRAILTAKDKAGNSYSYAAIDIPIDIIEPTIFPTRNPTKPPSQDVTSSPERSPTQGKNEGNRADSEKVVVQIKVLDKNNQPVNHARVEIHSDPMVSYTNEEGIALFENVPAGSHTIDISYANYHGEQKVTLSKDTSKHYNFDIKVTEVKKTSSNYSIIIFGGIVLFAVFVIVVMRRKKDRGQK